MKISRFLNFFWFFKGCSNKHGGIFDGVSKIDCTKILSGDSNYIVEVIMWPKFGNSSISMREVIITSIL